MHTRWNSVMLIGLLIITVVGGVVGAKWVGNRSSETIPPRQGVSPLPSMTQTDTHIAQLQARLRQTPDDWRATNDLGDAYLQKVREIGDPSYYAKAEALLQQSLALRPDNFNAMASLGSLALARHQFADARIWGEKARSLNPSQARIYGVIGDAQIELGRYPEAIATFQTMVNLRPDLASYSRVSYARELYGDLDGAIGMMQAAIESSAPYPENRAYLRVQLGNLYFTKGDLTMAEQTQTAALRDLPGYAPAIAGMAKLDAARGNYAAAIARYQDAMNRMPLPEYVIALGEAQQAAGKATDAARTYDLARVQERLFAANGVDVDTDLALFDADHGGDLARDLAEARAGYDRHPSIKAADAVAWILTQQGDHQAAQGMSREALRLGTQDPLMLFHAGMIAYRLGDLTAARTTLEHALALNPNFSVLYANLARQTLAAARAAGG